jgi:hypothetical protein
MEADRSDPIIVGPYRSTGIPDARLRLPEVEVRITQDAVRGFPGSRVRVHRVDIHYGWTGSRWVGSLNLALDPERDVLAFATQSPPENVDSYELLIMAHMFTDIKHHSTAATPATAAARPTSATPPA